MDSNIKHTWGWLSYHRTNFIRNGTVGEGKHNAYTVTFVDENYTEPGEAWQQVEITYWARHPIKAMRHICATPRTADELMTLDGATLD